MTEPTREAAYEAVLRDRERGRARPVAARAAVALVGGVLLVAALPLIVVLPEAGVPALLLALRLLAVEADWAARAYAWCDWRFAQVRAWYHRQRRAARVAVVIALLAIAAAIVWLLIAEL